MIPRSSTRISTVCSTGATKPDHLGDRVTYVRRVVMRLATFLASINRFVSGAARAMELDCCFPIAFIFSKLITKENERETYFRIFVQSKFDFKKKYSIIYQKIYFYVYKKLYISYQDDEEIISYRN